MLYPIELRARTNATIAQVSLAGTRSGTSKQLGYKRLLAPARSERTAVALRRCRHASTRRPKFLPRAGRAASLSGGHASPSVRGQLEKIARSRRKPSQGATSADRAGGRRRGAGHRRDRGTHGLHGEDRLDVARAVRRWPSIKALRDRPRCGRPARVTVERRAELVTRVCERPDGSKVAFHNIWTHQSLAETCGVSLSESEVGRIPRGSDLRPHTMRPWLHSADPDFRAKTRAVCQLYRHPAPGAHLACVDEKTGIQAIERRFAGQPAAPGRAARQEFEYRRHGTTGPSRVRRGHGQGLRRERTDADGERPAALHGPARPAPPKGDIWGVWDNFNTHTPPGSTRSRSGSASCTAACSSAPASPDS